MNILLFFSAVLVILFLFARRAAKGKFNQLRREGIYPEPGAATASDVEKLVKAGYPIYAMRCYREVYPQSSLAEAKAAVESIPVTQ